MSDSSSSTPEGLLAEAQRRADALRATGELPPDIDQRLADDHMRAIQRDTERSPVDPRPTFESMKAAPPISMSRVEPADSRIGIKTARRLVNRLERNELSALAAQSEEARAATISIFDALLAESDRLRRLADNAVATADMLAARVATLEREIALLTSPAESPDAATS